MCMQVKKHQFEPHMEQTSSKSGKEYDKTVCCHPAYLTYMQLNKHRTTARLESQAGIKIAGRSINNLRYADDSNLMAESEKN